MEDTGFDRGVDQPGNFRSKHSCGDTKVAADMIRVHVGKEILVDGVVWVVVICYDDVKVIDLGHLV